MTDNFTIVKGSFGYALNFALKDSAGAARNLAGYSVKINVWAPATPDTLVVNAEMTWVAANEGTCYFTIPAATTFATVGVYQYAVIPYVSTTVLDPALSGFITVTQGGGLYCTLEEVKAELDDNSNANDHHLMTAIVQVGEAIESYCCRSFLPVTETRYFDGVSETLYLDDLVSISGVGSGVWLNGSTTALASTDYELYPLNSTPKTRLEIATGSSVYSLAEGVKKGIKITANWGRSAVPEDVRRAAIMWTIIMETSRKAGYANTVGSAETGVITIDRDAPAQVKRLLDPYRKARWL